MGSEINLAKGTFSYQLSQGIVSDMFEVLVRELAVEGDLVLRTRGPGELALANSDLL